MKKKQKSVKCILCGTNYCEDVDIRIPYFITHAFETYKEKFNKKLYFGGGEAKLVEKLLRQIKLERLKMYWDFFLHYPENGNDWRLRGASKEIKEFHATIARIVQQCKIHPIPSVSQKEEIFVPEGYEDLQRGEELFNTLDSIPREKRIAQIIAELKRNPKCKGLFPKTLRDSAVAILKERLINETN